MCFKYFRTGWLYLIFCFNICVVAEQALSYFHVPIIHSVVKSCVLTEVGDIGISVVAQKKTEALLLFALCSLWWGTNKQMSTPGLQDQHSTGI